MTLPGGCTERAAPRHVRGRCGSGGGPDGQGRLRQLRQLPARGRRGGHRRRLARGLPLPGPQRGARLRHPRGRRAGPEGGAGSAEAGGAHRGGARRSACARGAGLLGVAGVRRHGGGKLRGGGDRRAAAPRPQAGRTRDRRDEVPERRGEVGGCGNARAGRPRAAGRGGGGLRAGCGGAGRPVRPATPRRSRGQVQEAGVAAAHRPGAGRAVVRRRGGQGRRCGLRTRPGPCGRSTPCPTRRDDRRRTRRARR
jgi:hypothetical protein